MSRLLYWLYRDLLFDDLGGSLDLFRLIIASNIEIDFLFLYLFCLLLIIRSLLRLPNLEQRVLMTAFLFADLTKVETVAIWAHISDAHNRGSAATCA